MLQRIQTIYLLLASICVFLMYAFSFAKIDVVTSEYIFSFKGLEVDGKNIVDIPFAIIIGLLAMYTLATIFLFKNRPAQLKMGRLNYLLHLVLVVTLFFSADAAMEKLPNGSAAIISYGVGFYLPVAAIAFLFLANRAIKADEKLVKSLERLR